MYLKERVKMGRGFAIVRERQRNNRERSCDDGAVVPLIILFLIFIFLL